MGLVAWVFFQCTSFAGALKVLKAMTGCATWRGSERHRLTDGWILVVMAADHLLGRSRLRLEPVNEIAGQLHWVGLGALAARPS